MPEQLSASYIIPFRLQDKARLANLRAILAWVQKLPQIEIIIVEQDESPKLSGLTNVQTIFQRDDGLFNKSKAINYGAELANCDVLILADADMILKHEALNLCIQACAEHADAVNPYTHLVDLTRSDSDRFIETQVLPNLKELGMSQRQKEGEQLCFCGGVYLMKRDCYFDIGGMDENFIGWGGEDDAMSIKLQTLGVNQLIKHDETAYHLWHQRDVETRYQHHKYQHNKQLLKQYQRMTANEMRQYCIKNKPSFKSKICKQMGYPLRY